VVTPDLVLSALQSVNDPELGFSVVDLGLIYDVRILPAGVVEIDATLTSMTCPLGPQMVEEMRDAVNIIPGVKETKVNLVWSPPWSPERMKEELRWILGR
jgi:metal-sulfur cluster biosynthetic enzyme